MVRPMMTTPLEPAARIRDTDATTVTPALRGDCSARALLPGPLRWPAHCSPPGSWRRTPQSVGDPCRAEAAHSGSRMSRQQEAAGLPSQCTEATAQRQPGIPERREGRTIQQEGSPPGGQCTDRRHSDGQLVPDGIGSRPELDPSVDLPPQVAGLPEPPVEHKPPHGVQHQTCTAE